MECRYCCSMPGATLNPFEQRKNTQSPNTTVRTVRRTSSTLFFASGPDELTGGTYAPRQKIWVSGNRVSSYLIPARNFDAPECVTPSRPLFYTNIWDAPLLLLEVVAYQTSQRCAATKRVDTIPTHPGPFDTPGFLCRPRHRVLSIESSPGTLSRLRAASTSKISRPG